MVYWENCIRPDTEENGETEIIRKEMLKAQCSNLMESEETRQTGDKES
ncbi:MAG: hypothetical protein JRJ76_04790 [Deltaproteobacteria bacterium]|jgi:hypothetical protein|nr:hypothetical protein [Deltaproteobacteria bacterium]